MTLTNVVGGFAGVSVISSLRAFMTFAYYVRTIGGGAGARSLHGTAAHSFIKRTG